MARQPWTPSADRRLRRMAATCTAKEIALVLGRTPNAVHQRAYLLKVPLQKAGDRDYRTKYPDAAVERARALHERGLPPSRIARDSGIPLGSIKSFVYFRGRRHASLALVRDGEAAR